MAGQAIPIKPIPAFYCVYVLRSTVRNASLYIGSTPDPPRRLKQHNGHVKGGARRTANSRLRPWEMATIVSGFPSAVAALKFEWALNNSHLTLHIPAELRLSIATRRKRGGRPRRPIPTLKSIIANVHLLTGVASFARWPLSVHFFTKDAHAAWQARIRAAGEPARPGLPVLTDFSGGDYDDDDGGGGGIHALKLDYSGMEEYVEKASEVLAFEREGKCVHCGGELRAGKGLFPMCPGAGCEAMGHLDCWSRYALRCEAEEGEGVVIPRGCDCPACGGRIRWGEMMKELSLRVRGEDEVEKVLKRRRRAKKAA